MTVVADQAVVPAYLSYADEKPLSDDGLATARAGNPLALPSEWTVVSGSMRNMTIEFAAAGDPAVPPGVILGELDRPKPQIVAREDIPLLWLSLQHGDATCQLEVATTETALARTWVDSLTQGGLLTSTSLGQTGQAGATAIIDAGDRLIRATYSDPWKGTGNTVDDVKHFGTLVDGMRGFLDSLVAAASD